MTVPEPLSVAELGARWPDAAVLWDRDVAGQGWTPRFTAESRSVLPHVHLELLAFDERCAHAIGTTHLDEARAAACRCVAWTGEAWLPFRAACYVATRSALRGRRFALHGLGSKMLWYMVQDTCAGEITPAAFLVPDIMTNAGTYDPAVAPGIVSFFLGGTPLPETGHAIRRFRPAVPATFDGMRGWDEARVGVRHVRIDDLGQRIVFRVHAQEAALAALGPEVPLVAPVQYVVEARRCPHCGQVPERYRVLRDGSQVCLACGASSPPA